MARRKSKNPLYDALEVALREELKEVTKRRDANEVDDEGKVVAKQGDYVYPTV